MFCRGSLFTSVRPLNSKFSASSLRSSIAIHTVGGSGKRAYDPLLLDAGGTFLQLAKPVEETCRHREEICTLQMLMHGIFRLELTIQAMCLLKNVGGHVNQDESNRTLNDGVGYKKPDAEIFKAALVESSKAVNVGDDQHADKVGADNVGNDCWLWGSEVKTFADIQDRIIRS